MKKGIIVGNDTEVHGKLCEPACLDAGFVCDGAFSWRSEKVGALAALFAKIFAQTTKGGDAVTV